MEATGANVGLARADSMASLPLQVFSRTMSSIDVGSTGPVISLLVAEKQEDREAKLRSSKSVAWKEPMLLLERIGAAGQGANLFQSKLSRSFRQPLAKGTVIAKSTTEMGRPSRWSRLWRKLRFDGGKKVHAARPEWLNYDAQSYAMNFETDEEFTFEKPTHQMPKISGPGAREIVTVLLKRSSSANRNSGCILIPRPVLTTKLEASTPLWKRRSVQAPLSIDTKTRKPFSRRRSISNLV